MAKRKSKPPTKNKPDKLIPKLENLGVDKTSSPKKAKNKRSTAEVVKTPTTKTAASKPTRNQEYRGTPIKVEPTPKPKTWTQDEINSHSDFKDLTYEAGKEALDKSIKKFMKNYAFEYKKLLV